MEGPAGRAAQFAGREHWKLRSFGPAKNAGPQDDTLLEVREKVTTETYGFDYAEN